MIKRFLVAACAAMFSLPAAAQSITPDSFEDTIEIGEMTMETFTVTTPATGPATDLVDVFFLADNTGSMGGFISAVQSDATALLSDIDATGLNVAFGVGSYFGDPSEFGTSPGNPTVGGNSSSFAYNLITPVTTDASAATSGIAAWTASGGGDTPEGGLFALHQIATEGGATMGGVSTGLETGWRTGATKVIVWFGDVPNHTDTVDVAEAISALTGEDVIVVAISVGFLGLNGSSGGEGPDQATMIASATGGLDLTATTSDIVDTILDAVSDVTATIDLDLFESETFAGLGVDIECVDALGCDDVGAGESRDFKVKFTGAIEGIYDFDLCVAGLSDVCSDIKITVADGGGTPVIPVPAALPLLLTGIAGLGFASRRRRDA
jgi:hypothetical protein